MVDHIQSSAHIRIFDEGVCRKHNNQTKVFNRQGPALTNSADKSADPLCEQPVERVINQKQKRDLRSRIAELFDALPTGTLVRKTANNACVTPA